VVPVPVALHVPAPVIHAALDPVAFTVQTPVNAVAPAVEALFQIIATAIKAFLKAVAGFVGESVTPGQAAQGQ
jgi:hypothetical protein